MKGASREKEGLGKLKMIVKIKRNSMGKLEENAKEIAKNIEQNKKEWKI